MAGDTQENRSNPGPSVAGVLHLGSVLGKGRHEVRVQAEGAQALSSVEKEAGGQSEAWGSAERSGTTASEWTYSQMNVPWGMVCKARTPQPILAVR